MEIKKEYFSSKDYNLNDFLNTCIASNENDIINFKLKIVQKEVQNEIDLHSDNIMKCTKTLHDDLKNINFINNNFDSKITEIYKTKVDFEKINELDNNKYTNNIEKLKYFLKLNK